MLWSRFTLTIFQQLFVELCIINSNNLFLNKEL